MDKLAISGFSADIYDHNINLVIGYKRVGSFCQLLKEAQYVADF